MASLQKLSTALNILEKYGSNLTSPSRPKYWRTVKHNNPVFRATVDAIHVSDTENYVSDTVTTSRVSYCFHVYILHSFQPFELNIVNR